MNNLSKYNKLWVALLGAVAQVFVSTYPDKAAGVIAAQILALLTALGVYVVPNKDARMVV